MCAPAGEDLMPYLDPLVAALMVVLQHGAPLSQRAALATMASAASAVERKFKPHAAAVMPLLQHYMMVRFYASPMSLRRQVLHAGVLKQCQHVYSCPR